MIGFIFGNSWVTLPSQFILSPSDGEIGTAALIYPDAVSVIIPIGAFNTKGIAHPFIESHTPDLAIDTAVVIFIAV